MTIDSLFQQHTARLQQELATGLSRHCPQAGAVLLHSGSHTPYYQDDQYPPFRAWGHFLRWLPVERPGQFLLLEPGARPVFYAIVPPDFWHDQSLDLPAWWADGFEIIILPDEASFIEQFRQRPVSAARCVFLGENSGSSGGTLADALGIAASNVNPPALLAWLDYQRAFKTDYEAQRIGDANARAIDGHQAAHDAFLADGDEYDIHLAYLRACRALDEELPYPSIVALDQHAAILHYQHKQRRPASIGGAAQRSQVLLIDAGFRLHGYCADITRTWARPGVHPVFQALLDGVRQLQQRSLDDIVSGLPYPTLHERAHQQLAELLLTTGVAHGTADELLELGVAQCFMPHGLGHLLGLQVHDVGGHQIDADGTILPPPERFPALRTTRTIAPGMVFTIEPGLYFIPMLLEKLRSELRQVQRTALLDWQLIEQLAPLGGIRIEDNVLVTDDGIHNLTRQPLLSERRGASTAR